MPTPADKLTDLTPGQRRRISQELESLQEQYDLLSEKLKRLRIDLSIQAGTTIQFQLEKQIGQFEAERKQLAQKIENLENKLQ
jgi:chromosome segregation ATPase